MTRIVAIKHTEERFTIMAVESDNGKLLEGKRLYDINKRWNKVKKYEDRDYCFYYHNLPENEAMIELGNVIDDTKVNALLTV